MQFKRALPAMFILFLIAGNSALAQEGNRTGLEFSTMAGVTLWQEHEGDDDATILAFPQGAAGAALWVFPAFRMTYWTGNPLLVDFGFSLLSLGSEGSDASLLNIEGGLSANFIRPVSGESRFIPYAGGLIGVLSISNGDTESELYLGGQLGARAFFRDYAAARIQMAYRHMMGDEFDFDTIELVGGISFFL